MPIYEYRCERCGQENEFLIIGKKEKLRCKQCGSEDLTKLLSAHNTSNSSSRRSSEPGPVAVAGRPIRAAHRGVAVPDRLPFLSERGMNQTWRGHLAFLTYPEGGKVDYKLITE